MNIGEKIKTLRLAKGLTTRELATLSEVNYSQLGKIERGINSPSITTANKILSALGHTIAIVPQCSE